MKKLNGHEIEKTIQTIPAKKLEWGKTLGRMTFEEAKKHEKNGWRLPTRVELLQAYDDKISGFNAAPYWSSSIYVDSPSYSWIVYFYDGDINFANRGTTYFVRCVREFAI